MPVAQRLFFDDVAEGDLPIYLRQMARVVTGEDGLWHPAADDTKGFMAHLVRSIGVDNTILDVVAWNEEDPSQWWFMKGVGIALGLRELRRVSWTDLDLRVTATPQEWLCEASLGRDSLCILNWKDFNSALIMGSVFGTVYCTEEKVAQALKKNWRHHVNDESLDIVGPIIG